MVNIIDNDTPVALLTVGQLKELFKGLTPEPMEQKTKDKKFVYGIDGIAKLFNCSIPTATRIKASGKIDKAITQVGRKIIVDAELALELAGEKQGGRKK